MHLQLCRPLCLVGLKELRRPGTRFSIQVQTSLDSITHLRVVFDMSVCRKEIFFYFFFFFLIYFYFENAGWPVCWIAGLRCRISRGSNYPT